MSTSSPRPWNHRLVRFGAAIALATLSGGVVLRAVLQPLGTAVLTTPPLQVVVHSDIAYDPGLDRYLQVYGDAPGAYAQLVDPNSGQKIGSRLLISCVGPVTPTTPMQHGCAYGQTPRMAYVGNDTFFVAMSTDYVGVNLNKKTIWGQLLKITTSTVQLIGTNVPLSIHSFAPAGYVQTIGGVAYNATKDEVMVVWSEYRPAVAGVRAVEERYDIYARSFSLTRNGATVTGIGAANFLDLNVSTSGGKDQLRPDVAYDPTSRKYLVVYEGDDPAAGVPVGKLGIWAKTIDASNALSGLFTISKGSYHTESAVIVMPNLNKFLVLWAQQVGSNPRFVNSRLFDPSASNPLTLAATPVMNTSQGQGAGHAVYDPGADAVFVAAMHGTNYLCGSHLNGNGALQGGSFLASSVVPKLSLYPRVASNGSGQFASSYTLNYTKVYIERRVVGGTPPICGPAAAPPPPPPPPPPPGGGGGGGTGGGTAGNGPALPAGQWITPLNTTVGDYDGDGRSDPTVYRKPTAQWLTDPLAFGALSPTAWGSPTLDIPIPADFDGDNQTDIAVFRKTTAEWFIAQSSNGSLLKKTYGAPATPYFDVPVPADYDGDGKADVAVYRRSTGDWIITWSSNNTVHGQDWGDPALGDIPAPADYDGDDKTDLAIYRTSTGQFIIRRSSDLVQVNATIGTASDMPVPADYNGDGKADPAVYNLTTGSWKVQLSGPAGGPLNLSWGAPNLGDTPVPGNYEGANRANIAVYRRSTGEWLIRKYNGTLLPVVTWGNPALGDIVRGF